MPAMHTYLADVFAKLEASRAALRTAVNAVPSELRRGRPAPDRWSAVDILEHIALVEGRFTAMIAKAIDEARAAGLGEERGLRDALPPQIATVVADRVNRRNAPEPVHPSGRLTESEAWRKLDEVAAQLRSAVTAGDGLALSGVFYEHPAFGRLNVYQWVELLAGHEMRHAAQIQELAART